MSTVSFQHAERNLAELLQRVEAGEEVVIERDGEPVARLLPAHQPDETGETCSDTQAGSQRRRPFGIWAGQVHIADDFDDELPEEIAAAFRGERP